METPVTDDCNNTDDAHTRPSCLCCAVGTLFFFFFFSLQLNLLPGVPEDEMMDPQGMGGMEVCPPSSAAAQAAGGVSIAGDATPLSQNAPGHRDRTLVYSTVGTPDYIAPEV